MTEAKEIYLDVQLRPHRSLSPRGLRNLILFIAAILFVISVAFLMIGAWPIVGFAGLDFILLYYAFKVNMKEARRLEHIMITSNGLELRRVEPSGEETITSIEPNWLQVAAIKRRGKNSAVRLRSHGKDIFVGSFLGPKGCKKLAADIQQAVEAYRVGDALTWRSV